MSLHEEKKELLAQIKRMREWVVEVEHIFDGSWASQAEEITNVEVARRFDAYLERLSCFVDAPERTEDETLRLGHLFKVLTHLRPGLVQCYDIEGFPRTNNEMERTIRAIKMQYRCISGRKNWNQYLLRYGQCVAYQEWWQQQPNGEACLYARLQHVAPASWRQVRQETRDCHREQLNRFHFRHRPLDYLASLEMRWEQTTGTEVCSHSLRSPAITVSILDKYAWECITEVIKNPDWVRSRVAELLSEVKPPIDVALVGQTIADIDAQMSNLFTLAQHATTQKTIDSLGMMMQTLEKQKAEAEALLLDPCDEAEEREELEQEIQGFGAWALQARTLLDDPTWTPTYQEKRNAVRALGVIATIYPATGDYPYRRRVDVTVPEIMKKINSDYRHCWTY